MNSEEIIASLRKREDSPEVVSLLLALEVRKKLKMPKDDIEARIDLPKKGLSLIFKQEGPKTSMLVFVAVQFFSDAEKGFVSFLGELPNKLLFSDNQGEVRTKLGKPTETNKEFRLDRWKQADYVLTVEYAKEDGQIAVITAHVPEYY